MDNYTQEMRFIYLLTSLVFVIFAVLPLFDARFIPTHDGEYHLIRFREFYTMLQSGFIFPRWAPNLNSGFGLPLFNFHYPFPNYIGSLFLLLGRSLTSSFQLTMAAAYLLSALFSFFWLIKLFSRKAALLGSVLSSYTPYWFVDLYIRGSVGEVWAIAWLMSTLAAVENKHSWLVSISLALLILSHNILAALFVPFIIIYQIIRQKKYIKHTVIGICLAGYFWIPALTENQFVTGLNVVNFRDHFPEVFQLLVPSWGTGFSKEGIYHDEMSFQIGFISLLSIGLTGWLFISEKDREIKKIVKAFIIFTCLIIFFMLPVSRPIWEFIQIMQFIQYPWRLLSFIIPITSFFGGYIAHRYQSFKLIIIFILLSVISSYSYTRPVTYEPRSDNYYLNKKVFTDGTSSIANTFSTRWTTWIRQRAKQKLEITSGLSKFDILSVNPLHYTAKIDAFEESTLRANIVYYPGWNVYLNGQKLTLDFHDGLLNFIVPSGEYKLDIIFEETFIRQLANYISLASLFWLVGLVILNRYESGSRYYAAL